MVVKEFPPKDCDNNLVNFESRYGIKSLPSLKALITRPNVKRDLLILTPSLSVCPVAPVLDCLSDPIQKT